MKLIKPKKIPSKMFKILYDTYLWGYKDSQEGKTTIDFETFKEKINAGYKRGVENKLK